MNTALGLVQEKSGTPEEPEEKKQAAPLAQLLHALNQPLTGLQCSMEVALAAPRTVEQYVQGLHDGLRLTERMRKLVEAIREVVDIEAQPLAEAAATDLKSLLAGELDDLTPVAEAKAVKLALIASFPNLYVRGERARLQAGLFRMLESVLALADVGSVLRIEAEPDREEVSVRVHWCGGRAQPASVLSPPEIGLLLAQVRLERSGIRWQRISREDSGQLTVTLFCA